MTEHLLGRAQRIKERLQMLADDIDDANNDYGRGVSEREREEFEDLIRDGLNVIEDKLDSVVRELEKNLEAQP